MHLQMKSRFLLFKASAGSGKTYNLALQYIAALLAGGEGEFRHTLAVTFTNKATSEMKERILNFLHDFWKGTGNPKDFENLKRLLDKDYRLNAPDEELRERCHRALRAILHDYSRFSVSTIDAFFQTVLRNMAHELGLNARLQVDLDDKDIIERAVDELIERNTVHDYLTQYIEQQLAEGRPWDVRRELKQMARLLFQEAFLKRTLDERNRPFDQKSIADFRRVLESEKRSLTEPVKTLAGEWEATLQRTGMDYETLCNYAAHVRRYVEGMKAGLLETNFNSYLAAMAGDPEKLLKSALRRDASLRPVAETLSGMLARLNEAQQRALRSVTSIDLALANLTPMGLLGAIDAEVSRLSNERNRFMLARTPIMLKRMIGDDDTPFIFERIGTRYHNIMIDEFQDTSQLQWENFRTLLLDNLATGGLSMVVGDIKQSIYRWRNGDWHILHQLEQQGYRGTPLQKKELRKNFRSLGKIVTFNNRLFPLAATELDRLGKGADARLSDLYADVQQDVVRPEEQGFVRIQLCHTTDREVMAAWEETMLADLCRQVADLHQRGIPYSEMTILVRKNRYIEPTIAYFAQHMPEVQLVSNEAFLLGSSVAVGMLMCALQMVDDVERDPVAVRYLMKHYVREVLHRGDAAENDYMLTNPDEVLPEAFIRHLDELRRLPLYELCETLYRLLRLQEIDRQEAYLFAFFDELSAYLHDNPSDIPTFVQYWTDTMQRKAIPGGDAEGIRIYSIHKSKGLAFHTVLMPYAEWDIEKDRNDALYWCSPQEEPLNTMGSLPIKYTTRVRESAFADDYLTEHADRRADELNGLYVAFTRAKANLYVWGLSHEELQPDNYNITIADLMHRCLPSVEGIASQTDDDAQTLTTYTFGTQPSTEGIEPGTEQEGAVRIGMASYGGVFSFRQSRRAQAFTADLTSEPAEGESRMEYIEQGKLLHYIFSQIATADDIDRVIRQFAQQGVLKSEQQTQQIRQLAQRGLHHERVRDWYSGHYRLFNECNILVPDPETGRLVTRRPDRVMTTDDRIIVVDFKFGRPREEYPDQVREYMRILQDMYPNHKVEGWLWYVYRNQVEEIEN